MAVKTSLKDGHTMRSLKFNLTYEKVGGGLEAQTQRYTVQQTRSSGKK
jgi:hypothetical protein